MFERIIYDVILAKTGRRLAKDLSFSVGTTAIFGPNESGKSMVLELLRFSLFGMPALRGVAADYTKLDVKTYFKVKQERYCVVRTLSKAVIERKVEGGWEPIATGVRPVNEKIIKILGFSMPVFDMSCAALQGKSASLSEMLPAERKRIVDSVIGIGAIDVVARWAGEAASTMNKEATTITETIYLPSPPDEPTESYTEDEIESARTAQRLILANEAFINTAVAEPIAPTCDVPIPSDSLKNLADQQQQTKNQLVRLSSRLDSLPAKPAYELSRLTEMETELEAFEKYEAAQRWLKANPKPLHTVEELRAMLQQWGSHDRYKIDQEKREGISGRITRLTESSTVTCPSCEHQWCSDHQQLDNLNRELLALGPQVDPVEAPTLRVDQIKTLLSYTETYNFSKYDEMLTVPQAPEVSWTKRQIEQWRKEHQLSSERPGLEDEIRRLEAEQSSTDFMGMYQKRLRYEAQLQTFEGAMLAYQRWVDQVKVKRSEIEQARPIAVRLEPLLAIEQKWTVYKIRKADYDGAKTRYDDMVAKATELKAKADQFTRIKTALVSLRAMVKQYLLPSLNVVASQLLSDMTGGQRTSIVVNEDFEITVDGQPVHTLSGSGIVCTNIALRLALGQVLTNGVFSVFLADEIDSSMDDNRAANTASMLHIISNRISQILMVSHKSIDADHIIDFGANNDAGRNQEAVREALR